MRVAGALGLILAVAMTMLAVTQVSGIEDNLAGVTSGALQGLVNSFTLLTLLLAGVVGFTAIIGAIAVFWR